MDPNELREFLRERRGCLQDQRLSFLSLFDLDGLLDGLDNTVGLVHELEVEGYHFDDEGPVLLADAVARHTTLEKVSFSFCGDAVSEIPFNFFHALAALPNLKHFRFNVWNNGGEDCQHNNHQLLIEVGLAVSLNQSLQSFQMMGFSPHLDLQPLFNNVKQLPHLEKLWISHDACYHFVLEGEAHTIPDGELVDPIFGENWDCPVEELPRVASAMVAPLANMIQENMPHLQDFKFLDHLDTIYCALKPKLANIMGAFNMQPLLLALGTNTHLKKLYLSSCALKESDLDTLINILEHHNHTLEELHGYDTVVDTSVSTERLYKLFGYDLADNFTQTEAWQTKCLKIKFLLELNKDFRKRDLLSPEATKRDWANAMIDFRERPDVIFYCLSMNPSFLVM